MNLNCMKKEKRSIKTSFVQRKEKESQKRAKNSPLIVKIYKTPLPTSYGKAFWKILASLHNSPRRKKKEIVTGLAKAVTLQTETSMNKSIPFHQKN